MNEIGELLRTTREGSGVSLEEASADLEIKTLILENIEDGNIGCFKDIFVLKDYLKDYAKYLGLDDNKIIDDFNEFLFEYTSKIPLDDIEKAMKEQKREEHKEEDRIISPYTVPQKRTNSKLFILLYVILAVLVVCVVVWSVKQITLDSKTTNVVNYVK